ncbi:hypothetical protein FOZ62_024089, partial [Perkinsus olseni]
FARGISWTSWDSWDVSCPSEAPREEGVRFHPLLHLLEPEKVCCTMRLICNGIAQCTLDALEPSGRSSADLRCQPQQVHALTAALSIRYMFSTVVLKSWKLIQGIHSQGSSSRMDE